MDNLRLNPEQRLDLVVAGTKEAVMMVESEAYELSEKEMLGAVKFGHEQLQPVIDLIIDLAEDAAKEPMDFSAPDYTEIYSRVEKIGKKIMTKAFSLTDKQERTTAVAEARANIIEKLTEEDQSNGLLGSAMKKLESNKVREAVIKKGKRID